MSTLRLFNRPLDPLGPDGQSLLAEAHQRKERVFCCCRTPPLPMYVAMAGDRFIVKRMPNSGAQHATECDSFCPPEALSGYGQVSEGAIQENVEDGTTTLRLDFSLNKTGTRLAPVPGDGNGPSVKAIGSKLSLRGLLHFLWDNAGFNRWSPAMQGRRSWAVVRKFLLLASLNTKVKGSSLQERLYLPEPFNAETKEEQASRRMTTIMRHCTGTSKSGLMLALGEVKELTPCRYGHRLLIKHAPDFPLYLAEDLYKRLVKRFGAALELSAAQDSSRLIVLATFGMSSVGVASVEELTLMNVDEHWLPFETAYDHQLLATLHRGGRRFLTGLRYNLPIESPLATAMLTDTGDTLTALFVVPPGASDMYLASLEALKEECGLPTWVWYANQPMPPLPAAQARHGDS